MDLIYIVLLLAALIFLCVGKNKISKTLLFITLISYLTLIIQNSVPRVLMYNAFARDEIKSLGSAVNELLQPHFRLVPLSLSLFFTYKRKRNLGIIFIVITIIAVLMSHWNSIISLAYSGVK